MNKETEELVDKIKNVCRSGAGNYDKLAKIWALCEQAEKEQQTDDEKGG